MDKQGTAWFDELKRYAAECRRLRPLPNRADLSPEEAMQCRIIGESLTNWLSENRFRLFQEGDAIGNVEYGKRKPFLVFTSSPLGILAAQEILGGDLSSTSLLATEFEDWEKGHPDNVHNWHVHFRSDIGPPGPMHLLTGEPGKDENGFYWHLVPGKSYFDKNPLSNGETYWVLGQSTTWEPMYRHGGDRLWKWNGEEAVFVRNLGRWVS